MNYSMAEEKNVEKSSNARRMHAFVRWMMTCLDLHMYEFCLTVDTVHCYHNNTSSNVFVNACMRVECGLDGVHVSMYAWKE